MGAVETTYTFTATDTITSTKMNNIIDQTIMTGDAISGSTLEVTTSGKLKVRALGITSNEIANGQVTSDKILDGTIVNADINASAAIELSKLATGALPTAITIASANIVNGTIVADDIADASITAPKMDGAQTGLAPIFGVRAWVNFDAQRDSSGASNTSNTNRYIRASGNVSRVLKDANGLFTVTFITQMPNNGYAVSINTSDISSGTGLIPKINTSNLNSEPSNMSTTDVQISMNGFNPRTICVMIIG